ncbi:hypothetical protein JOB18_042429 [Solea senegalensis]|uniref:Uncharacterized protein n=1 Tax=Solea senegalensis TaxID=28829 RepID=A0AAV6QZD0_SOLSE|nr:hypothetical protein JOB18_042429 [Solea senegalensis]
MDARLKLHEDLQTHRRLSSFCIEETVERSPPVGLDRIKTHNRCRTHGQMLMEAVCSVNECRTRKTLIATRCFQISTLKPSPCPNKKSPANDCYTSATAPFYK